MFNSRQRAAAEQLVRLGNDRARLIMALQHALKHLGYDDLQVAILIDLARAPNGLDKYYSHVMAKPLT